MKPQRSPSIFPLCVLCATSRLGGSIVNRKGRQEALSFLKIIHHSLNPILYQSNVEVDEKTKPAVGKFQVSQYLCVM